MIASDPYGQAVDIRWYEFPQLDHTHPPIDHNELGQNFAMRDACGAMNKQHMKYFSILKKQQKH